MLPIYFLVGLINLLAQHNNYGIKVKDPNFDIRVRRSIQDTAIERMFNIPNDIIKRGKRYAYYTKTRITNNDISRYNNSYGNNIIINPNWNILFNTTRNNENNSGINNGYNNRPFIRSYPYGYPPGYGPRTDATPGYNRLTATPGYRNQNNNKSNTPYFYNYQNPNGLNFAGFFGYNASKSGYINTTSGYNNYNNVPAPYAPRYTPRPNNTGVNNYTSWNSMLAPYPPSYTQKPVTNSFAPANNIYNNLPSPYAPTNNSGIHKLPYAPNLANNGVYNNIPAPYTANPSNNNNLAPYAPNYNPTGNNTFAYNTTTGNNNFNNTPMPYAPVFNNSVTTPGNGNLTATTTEKIVTGCVICNIPCPQFMRRFGRFCIHQDADDDF